MSVQDGHVSRQACGLSRRCQGRAEFVDRTFVSDLAKPSVGRIFDPKKGVFAGSADVLIRRG